MKQWIKEHPWRLEIAPFLMVVLAVVLPILYRQEMLPHIKPEHGLTLIQVWFCNHVMRLSLLAMFWLFQSYTNHLWVATEQKKCFNYNTVYYNAVMLLFGFSNWEVLKPGIIWSLSAIVLVMLSVLLEYTRPFVAKDQTLKPSHTVKEIHRGDHFYYREHNICFLTVVIGVPATMLVCSIVLLFIGKWWLVAALTVPYMLIILRPIHTSYVVTLDRIIMRYGFRKKTILMQEIQNCRIEEHPAGVDSNGEEITFESLRKNWFLFLPSTPSAPSLYIETHDGRFHRFPMRSPETACALINTALSAHNHPEAQR